MKKIAICFLLFPINIIFAHAQIAELDNMFHKSFSIPIISPTSPESVEEVFVQKFGEPEQFYYELPLIYKNAYGQVSFKIFKHLYYNNVIVIFSQEFFIEVDVVEEMHRFKIDRKDYYFPEKSTLLKYEADKRAKYLDGNIFINMSKKACLDILKVSDENSDTVKLYDNHLILELIFDNQKLKNMFWYMENTER